MLPIRLCDHKPVAQEFDEAGITILKTVFSSTIKPVYETRSETSRMLHLPKLEYFCLNALIEYPDQLHFLGSKRLKYSECDSGFDVLQSLIPNWKSPFFSLLEVDPRIWAVLIQTYSNLPDIFYEYRIDLEDQYLPLLQEVSSTPDFALITTLQLRNCAELTDDTIFTLKTLHHLCVLDVSGTKLSSYGLRNLSKTLTFSESGQKRGPWALRILHMQDCRGIDRQIFDFITEFPLLSAIDLRHTRCIPTDVKAPFEVTSRRRLFHRNFVKSINALHIIQSNAFSHARPFSLEVEQRSIGQKSRRQPSSTRPEAISHIHNSFVVLPAKYDSYQHSKPNIYVGNADILEMRKEAAKKAERKSARELKRSYRSHRYGPGEKLSGGVLHPVNPYSTEEEGDDGLTIYRWPPPWSTLDEIPSKSPDTVLGKKQKTETIKLQHKGNVIGKEALQTWQERLTKRRRSEFSSMNCIGAPHEEKLTTRPMSPISSISERPKRTFKPLVSHKSVHHGTKFAEVFKKRLKRCASVDQADSSACNLEPVPKGHEIGLFSESSSCCNGNGSKLRTGKQPQTAFNWEKWSKS